MGIRTAVTKMRRVAAATGTTGGFALLSLGILVSVDASVELCKAVGVAVGKCAMVGVDMPDVISSSVASSRSIMYTRELDEAMDPRLGSVGNTEPACGALSFDI